MWAVTGAEAKVGREKILVSKREAEGRLSRGPVFVQIIESEGEEEEVEGEERMEEEKEDEKKRQQEAGVKEEGVGVVKVERRVGCGWCR